MSLASVHTSFPFSPFSCQSWNYNDSSGFLEYFKQSYLLFHVSGFGSGSLNTSMHGAFSGVRGPFTPSQWIELEHQALIYKYITANVPVPSNLLIPIRKSLNPFGFGLSGSSSTSLAHNSRKLLLYFENGAPGKRLFLYTLNG